MAAALLCFPLAKLQAHDALPPGQSEMQINGRQVRLIMSLPASVLSAYDLDRDGMLSASELAAHRAELISHFLQAITVRSQGQEVRWDSVTPATAIHGKQADPGHAAVHFLARGQFSEFPATVELRQRLWGPTYLRNQLSVILVKERTVLQREVRLLTQQTPTAEFISVQ